ncbi:MAG: exosortase/archaeosortase family protein [archaeon]|jgi:exosortase/archaeosortase family protein
MPIKKKKVVVSKKNDKSIIASAKNYFSKQEEKIVEDKRKQFAFFILGFILFYLVVSALAMIVPSELYKGVVGNTVQGVLAIEGVTTQSNGFVTCTESNWIGLEITSNCYSFDVNGKTILISWLCTGVLEIIVLIAAMLASFGVNWEKKIKGIGLAIVAGIIFNILRIAITVNIVLTQNLQTIELAHDLLFRLVLFIYIVGVYVMWFNWAMKSSK